ncbi:MAG: hypothetical protein K9G11_03575, partial [Rickettsiaceae bacterium]|nr:hypothetical protein [Rickettsiaceae bacterium]
MGILGEVAVKPLALEACGVVKDLAANYELPKFDEGFLSSLGNDEAAEFFGCTLQAANNWRLYLRFGQQVQASPKAYIDLGDGVWHQLEAKNLPPVFRQLTSQTDFALYLKNNELQLEQLASGDVGLSVVAAKLPAMELPKHKLNELIQQWQRLQTLNVAELTSLSSYLTTTNPELERA